ncbi:alpha/beta hydrolase [Ktedonosporobacter rubrisoli]|uniref:Alpha/beta hydrolase n=1 Tax=Ktedonosporobacter rubrisoli TaxID=2509675 RepID=A0A4P6JJD6_KTERU|nr:alpha/beta hydrolase [Ktedonosporobacter rubrisoli]QBD74776.1 alpha/beta hydrolase [Ktedonosporobacter rubrisoli]
MSTKQKHYKLPNGDVQLAVSETGQGQTLLFFNGGGATQVAWKRLISELQGQYRLVTFDFRNHGKSTTSRNTSLESFMTDAETIMNEMAGDRPILIGWSLGADLAVWYAASHPGKVAGLFLIDGAVPVNLVSDPEDVRRRLDTPMMRIGPLLLYLTGMGYRLTPDQFATLTIELNKRREQLLAAYEQLDCPVELVLATKSAGEKGERAERTNALWRAGGEQLAQAFPELSLSMVDNTHLLPIKEPAALAQLLEAFVQRCQSGAQSDTPSDGSLSTSNS